MNKTLSIVTIFLITFLLTTILSFNSSALSNVGENGTCAALTTILPDGNDVVKEACTSDNVAGLVMLDFVSATCSYCLASLPQLAEFTKDMQNQLTIRQIGVDRNVNLLRQFWTQNRAHMVMDLALDNTRILKNAYKVMGVPSYIILDKSQKIIYSHEGTLEAADYYEIRELVKANSL